jgi:hypothetical protein
MGEKVAATVHKHGAGGAAMEEAQGSAKKENGEGCRKKKLGHALHRARGESSP